MNGELVFNGYSFSWGDEKVLARDGGEGWHNNVNVLNTIELYAKKMMKMVNFVMYILPP